MPVFYYYLLGAWALGLLLGLLIAAALAAGRLARAKADLVRLQAQFDALAAAREELADRFQVLAARILDSQSQRLTAQNREALGALLGPLGEKIVEFKQRVEQVHVEDVRHLGALQQEVQDLAKRSFEVGEKADRLAAALQGDNKAIGNWGELVLERLLENSGLQRGRDYDLQVSASDEDGRRFQPDAVLHLPENRCVVVDAKTSLKDYMDYANAAADDARAAALRAHVASVEAHVKGLVAKRYQDLDAFRGRSPDFVLMFIPSEPAFALAVTAKPALFETAARAGAILVGPGGLLATLRLVDQIWRMEKQRGVLNDVFDAVRKIYEKYVTFVEDMQRIDDQLQKAQAAYRDAYKKLATGDGNLVRQLEKFRKENIIKPKKLPPPAFQDTETENPP
ncbi:MAG: DNA recombination protein RmuC [Spartobacteria bacterium]|nr:DNA recombination protein RmuC [Spartobacteria bacterium]